MPASTSRGAVRYPLGTDPPDTDGDIRKVAEDVAARFAIFDESATRPAAGTRGRLHRNPATGEVTWDTGTAWEALSVGKLGGISAPLYLLTSDANAAYAPKAAIAARGFLAAAQSIPNSVATALSFTSENFDSDAIHDNATNSTRFTCPAGKGGIYAVTGTISYDAHATGTRAARIHFTRADGSASGVRLLASVGADPTAGIPTRVPIADLIDMVPGDYVELFAFQSSGAALNAASSLTTLSIFRVGT